MPSALTLTNSTPRFGLPLLYAAQAQKEVVANESFALADALLHCAIEGTASAPPVSPTEGANWLVGTGATGAWAGPDGNLACLQNGNWVFIAPRDGMQLLNRSNGQWKHFFGGWQAPSTPSAPTGGAVVDDVARATIDALISALKAAGIFSTS